MGGALNRLNSQHKFSPEQIDKIKAHLDDIVADFDHSILYCVNDTENRIELDEARVLELYERIRENKKLSQDHNDGLHVGHA